LFSSLARRRDVHIDIIRGAEIIAHACRSAVVPTFAGYVPMVSAAVSVSSRRASSSYWTTRPHQPHKN
jgi:hypothetical protein